jgi:GxxExxY protein
MEPSIEIDALATGVIGAAIEVHRLLGPGYLESVYEDALSTELELQQILFERQKSFSLSYKHRRVGEGRLDFLVDGCLVVEIKAVERLLPIHKAQVISYLKATRQRVGLLINFNERMLKTGIQRIVWSEFVAI